MPAKARVLTRSGICARVSTVSALMLLQHWLSSKPVLGEGITKQQTWLLALLGFPFSEVDHVHVPAETHCHGTAVPPAHSSIVIRIRTVTRVIIRVWAK